MKPLLSLFLDSLYKLWFDLPIRKKDWVDDNFNFEEGGDAMNEDMMNLFDANPTIKINEEKKIRN